MIRVVIDCTINEFRPLRNFIENKKDLPLEKAIKVLDEFHSCYTGELGEALRIILKNIKKN